MGTSRTGDQNTHQHLPRPAAAGTDCEAVDVRVLFGDTRRLDLHNAATNYSAAMAGRCGFTHLASGRICLLRYRHPGACRLASIARR